LFHLGADLRRTRVNGTPQATELRRLAIMESNRIGLVVDIGANTGQYGSMLRRSGYKGPLLSIEPLSAAFRELSRRAGRDPNWSTIEAAVGAQNTEAEINVSANSASSSLLPMEERHLLNASNS